MKVSLKTLIKNCAAAVTPEQLSVERKITSFVRIKARTTNTNPVFIGNKDSQDYPLTAGQELPLNEILSKSGADEIDLSEVWLKVTTNGEGVAVIYGTKP